MTRARHRRSVHRHFHGGQHADGADVHHHRQSDSENMASMKYGDICAARSTSFSLAENAHHREPAAAQAGCAL